MSYKKRLLVLLILLIFVPFFIFNENECKSKYETRGELGDPLGDKEIFAFNLTESDNIIIDGDLEDWSEIPKYEDYSETFGLAFNSTHIMIAIEWYSYDSNNQTPYWYKYGDLNDTHAYWDLDSGNDEIISVGFMQNNTVDLGVWTASYRTEEDLCFEYNFDIINGTYTVDNGSLPYIQNFDKYVYRPIWDNNSNPIPFPETTIPDGTVYNAWFDSKIRPNESQNDMFIQVKMDNTTDNHRYSAEIIRKLNTGHSDDLILNLSEPIYFFFDEVSSYYSRWDLFALGQSYKVSFENELALFEFFELEDDNPEKSGTQIYDSQLLRGIIYDDYIDYELMISCSKWGAGTWYYIRSINEFTGEWLYELEFNDQNFDLGINNITIRFKPQFEEAIIVTRTFFVEDVEPPEIQGISNLSTKYPNGIPPDIFYIDLAVGINDNYYATNTLNATLFFKQIGENYEILEMTQFYPESQIFSATIFVNHDEKQELVYQYFIRVEDNSSNSIDSEIITFSTQQGTPFNQGTTMVTAINFSELLLTFVSSYTIIAFVLAKRKNNKTRK